MKPRVYLETTVISYLVGRPSNDPTLASWQQITRQLWENYTDRFAFVISPIVLAEVSQGNPEAVQRRLEVLSHLTVLEILSEADILTQKLLDAGAVPQNFRSDAEHIAIATVHQVEYLASWNHKHIVNANKREYINQVCREAGFKPTTICTPTDLIGEFQMKEEDFENYTDPILEECYRMKEEFNAQFNSVEELSAHLRKVQEECRRKGMKVVSYYVPPEKRKQKKEINCDATRQKSSTENTSRGKSQ
ncbi:type II toxin-antitoxin system VapC family toxin [Candidatus Poribacteria bacterium]|nr:type II toxin-antitoxin system VapC family toxin [Candidatus Poribacteria bacterium]MYK24942.1 type II toxin-antitoxin system VapC family toxin [Candidatus Poribacteria bacterium]